MNFLILRLQLFYACTHIGFTLATLQIFAGVIVYFKFCLHMFTRHGWFHQEIRLGLFEIEVVKRIDPGLNDLIQKPVVYMITLTLFALFWRIIRYLFISRHSFVGTDGVWQYKDMLAVFVLEVIVNPFLLHQSTDEIKIRLTVLNTIFPFPVGTA